MQLNRYFNCHITLTKSLKYFNDLIQRPANFSFLKNSVCFYHDMPQKSDNTLIVQLTKSIRKMGPISVMEFMKEALANSQHGYYVKKDPLGESGDFITSPELNQMFGELIAIWFLNHWTNSGKMKDIQFVELGPGRGTLTEDILRTCGRLENMIKDVNISVHLVGFMRKKNVSG